MRRVRGAGVSGFSPEEFRAGQRRPEREPMVLDERGIPVLAPGELCAPACPPRPCGLCTGDSAVVLRREPDGTLVRMTSWEWCRQSQTCAATVDWEGAAGR